MAEVPFKMPILMITVDRERRILRDGAVAIDDDSIIAVAKSDGILRQLSAKRALTLPGSPRGPVDTHVRNIQQSGHGLADGGDMRWPVT